jgi:AraC family transcriptional regulator of adaptative response / DNA-3-methyladenine glycosylase II
MNKDDVFYRAMLARDKRFDGKFFVGVKTTGIYCRPVCPARPHRKNIEFFASAALAEKEGYRPCLRCRPEVAPQSAAWMGTSAIVQRALRKIHSNQAASLNEGQFAELFGVGPRHLRRLFTDEIGKTPKQIAFEHRLKLSRKLIAETALPITEIAYASGFGSIRRFNDAFKKHFRKRPSDIPRKKQQAAEPCEYSKALKKERG